MFFIPLTVPHEKNCANFYVAVDLVQKSINKDVFVVSNKIDIKKKIFFKSKQALLTIEIKNVKYLC